MENYGIENLKIAAVKLLNFYDGIHDRLKDGKFDLADIIATVADVPQLIFVFNNFEGIKQEIIDIDSDEATLLCDYIRENTDFGQEDEKLLNIIVAAIDLLGSTYARFMALLTEIKDEPEG